MSYRAERYLRTRSDAVRYGKLEQPRTSVSEPKAYYPALVHVGEREHLVSVLDLDNVCSFQQGYQWQSEETPGHQPLPFKRAT